MVVHEVANHERDPAENVSLALVPRRDTFELAATAWPLAERLCKTEFVPKGLQNRPEAVLAAMLTGNDLGLSPMVALSHIYIIDGRPSLSATSQRALILSHGHELWWGERTITRAVLFGRRHNSTHVTEVTWTMDDARSANLAAKDVWRKYPRAMLMARCTGELGRAIFADVLIGVPYAKEELEDGGWTRDRGALEAAPDAPAEAATTGGKTRRRAARAATEPPPPPPDAAPEPPGAAVDATYREEPPPPPEPPSDPSQGSAADPVAGEMPLSQQIAMHCREAGIERKTLIKAVTGLERGSELTREQAIEVLEAAKRIRRGEARLELMDDEWGVAPREADQ